MAIGQYPTSPSARRAEMMRQAWRPVGHRLSHGANRFLDSLSTYPLLTQGTYYVLTGLWPWVHMDSFLWVTGPKTDLWLVQTVGVLVAVIGAALWVASFRHENTWAISCLALGSALALGFVDVLFVVEGRIPIVYLLDAALEAGLIGLWIYGWRTGHVRMPGDCVQPPPVVTAPPQQQPAAPPGAAVNGR